MFLEGLSWSREVEAEVFILKPVVLSKTIHEQVPISYSSFPRYSP
ncbi:MAG: hypothetical protein MjAS7_1084 [Metallosphaera javensis (ex Sakai et al. 2022)]|nr:MAG: hypothetical protein MjAS7_1084 [Metallosphaera javensis (ex Sakai et al. 2022)]